MLPWKRLLSSLLAIFLLSPLACQDLKPPKIVAACRNADGGYGVTPGSPSTDGGTYFAGIILRWLDTK